ncbi:hypothetical protein GB931_01385 [Modestobacter sp. I12A-02628]|uniref:Uncharacterized protein n=1 Tax=Goekera deserti TaxID=2497753 RepID=A0A7K3WG91_9ACTN|nr:hypothetical protein [Goekera deserti]MPQ96594.1 hypothetical protein [Goekera deserti]NDI47094.1 hypothetical protein [Goekera deserti]NEL55508.1 hypothetical protein [Goekera deserti]
MTDIEDDGTDALAALLGEPAERVLRVLGGGWERAEVATRYPPGAEWFAAGVPAQVLVGVAGRTLAVARPVPRRDPSGGLRTDAADVAELAVEDMQLAPDVVTAAVDLSVRRRRASFRWCLLCRQLTAPESAHDRRSCRACAVRFRGAGR